LAVSLASLSYVKIDDPSLKGFSKASATWFSTTFQEPTLPQTQGWPAIAAGNSTLILAPTGSGKTLTAFFWGLNKLTSEPPPEDKKRRTRILYISPLRALAVDVEKNLKAPLQGVKLAAERLGENYYEPTVAIRSGDTPASERSRLGRNPPDLLITTPESLYLMLTSKIRETLVGVETVIIDEIHALAATKRGAHLALSLERLEQLTEKPLQRIGLSATQRPLEVVAKFLGGYENNKQRQVTIVDTGISKELDIEVVVPIEDMGSLGEPVYGDPDNANTADTGGPVRRSIWPSMHPELLDLIKTHNSTIVFVNARRLAERLATRLNELYLEDINRGAEAEGISPPQGEELVMAHHGSLSRVQRLAIEDRLKSGTLKGLVATSSLELGIDMGAVDLVVQVESPGAVSRGLQRVGRAGHQVGAPSVGKFFPKHRADLLEVATVTQRMKAGLIEKTTFPRNAVDVLAQQIVAACAMQDWDVAELKDLCRGAANYSDISDEVFDNVLDLLAGRYPSDEFAELRPRIIWDRVSGVVKGRPGSQRLAVTSGGTIPDRGLYGVFLPDGTRVGELDEEMVYESRVGENFLLGASTWRIEDITHERVVVTPAPGQPGKMPFWHGDGPGRPLELGRAIGDLTDKLLSLKPAAAKKYLIKNNFLDELSAKNLLAFIEDQKEFSGHVPSSSAIVVERFRDEIGDWRICVLSPFGAQVHAPWGMALQHLLSDQWGVSVEMQWSDDGIIIRLPEAIDQLPTDELAIDPDELEAILVSQLPNSAMFAARFRECAARALLLPKLRPDKRTPLWQQRQKAAGLLQVAAKYPSFPILLETSRECLNDVFDLPALKELLTQIRSRKIKLVPVDTNSASPFAQSLMFDWIAQYMYEGDAPLAERRAASLSLDQELLRDLLGAEELRELLDPEVLKSVEAELQRTDQKWKAKSVDHVEDLLRWLGPLTVEEITLRCKDLNVEESVAQLLAERRIIEVALPNIIPNSTNPVVLDPDLPVIRDSTNPVVLEPALPVIPDPDRESPKGFSTLDGESKIWYASAEDASRLRDALGVALPAGLPAVFTDSVAGPVIDLVSRFSRTRGPFVTEDVVNGLGLSLDRAAEALSELERQGRVVKGEFLPAGSGSEWCHNDVLQTLRRRSLAALRKEIEPVQADTLARFLPSWQHVGSKLFGVDGLAEVITNLQGAGLPASILESDILSSRVVNYQPSFLDTLLTSGELIWVGQSSLGSNDGRIKLLWRDNCFNNIIPGQHQAVIPDHKAVIPDPDRESRSPVGAGDDDRGKPDVPVIPGQHQAVIPGQHQAVIPGQHQAVIPDPDRESRSPVGAGDDADTQQAILNHLQNNGASFWSDLLVAVKDAGCDYSVEVVLTCLWDLVWQGLVSNDSFTPLRSLNVVGKSRKPSRRGRTGSRRVARSLSRTGPASATGRWVLTKSFYSHISSTELLTNKANQLLERYGILTREMALAEGTAGGFAGVYTVLKEMEERGQVRRGYFIEGLGAAQFALPGAVDRLRDFRAKDPAFGGKGSAKVENLVLAATDPAQPYGASIQWPQNSGRPSRSVGAYVVLSNGLPLCFLDRGAKSLVVFELGLQNFSWINSLRELVTAKKVKAIVVQNVNSNALNEFPEIKSQLLENGFAAGYKGPTFRG